MVASINSSKGFQANLFQAVLSDRTFDVEMVCVWAVQHGVTSHMWLLSTGNATSVVKVLILVCFNQFKSKQHMWSAATVPDSPSLAFPAPSAFHELLFGYNVYFCCKTKETLLQSTEHFNMYSV